MSNIWYNIVVGADVKKLQTPYKERTCPFFSSTSAGRGWIHRCVSSPIRFSEKGIP